MERYHAVDTDLLVKASEDVCFQVNVTDLEVIKLLCQQTTMSFVLMDQGKRLGVRSADTSHLILDETDHHIDKTGVDIIAISGNKSFVT